MRRRDGPQVLSAMVECGAVQQAVPFLEHCLAGFQHEFALCAAAAGAPSQGAAPDSLAADPADAGVPPPPSDDAMADASGGAGPGNGADEPLLPEGELLANLLELLPFFAQAATGAGAVELAKQAHALAHAHLPPDHPAFSKVGIEMTLACESRLCRRSACWACCCCKGETHRRSVRHTNEMLVGERSITVWAGMSRASQQLSFVRRMPDQPDDWLQVTVDYAGLLAQAPDADNPQLADELLREVHPSDQEPLHVQVCPTAKHAIATPRRQLCRVVCF